MNVADYFNIISTDNGVFKFEFKGYLSDEIIDAIGDTIKHSYFSAVDTFQGSPFITYADLRRLKAVPNKAKKLIAALMEYGKARNLYCSINVNPSAIASMSIADAGSQSDSNNLRIVVATTIEADELLALKVSEMKENK